MTRIPSSLLRFSFRLRLFDVAAAGLAPVAATLLREPGYFTRNDLSGIAAYTACAIVATIAALLYFRVGQILARYLAPEDVTRMLKAAAAAASLTAGAAFMLMRLDAIPRSMPALHFLMLAAALIGARALMAERYRREDIGPATAVHDSAENVILVGATRLAWLYIRMLRCLPNARQRVVAVLDDHPRLQGRSVGGHIVAGGLARADAMLTEYATHGVAVHRLIIMFPGAAERLAAEKTLAPLCAARGVALESMAERLDFAGPDPAEETAAAELVEPLPPARAAVYWRVRRLADVVAAGALLIVLSPVFLLVAMVVALDVGPPVVFWQERVGRYSRTMAVYKFRTFAAPVNHHGASVPEDKRLSRIGRFLRATRLDELPQLWNILRGDMSLIGPRPLLPIDIASGASLRQQARPGITGWAQVHGGKLVTAEEKNALDEWYICHVSPIVDLRILRLTLLAPFRGDRRRQGAVDRALQFQRQRRAGRDTPAATTSAADAPTKTFHLDDRRRASV